MKQLNQLLQQKFEELKSTNPRFSLRALATKAEISPGHLSEVLSGKRPISRSHLEKLIRPLRFSDTDIQFAYERLKVAEELQKVANEPERILTNEDFAQIAHQDYFNALAAMDLSSSQLNAEYISKKIGLPVEQTKNILQVLTSLGVIKEDTKGSLYKTLRSISTQKDIPNFDIQAFHDNSLEQTQKTFRDIPVEQRDMIHVSMAVNPEHIPFAKKELEKCCKKVYAKLSQGEKTAVYRLGIQLLPVNHTNH